MDLVTASYTFGDWYNPALPNCTAKVLRLFHAAQE
jgi:hypothetical protein